MTEYDFSPEAYERHMRTQQRIANWVDQTEEHRPQFGSAVAPSSQHGTQPTHSRPHHLRHHSEFGRRRPSFSSSSGSSSSSRTDDSEHHLGAPGPMPAFQPMYLQHPVADQPHSSGIHRSDSYRPHDSSSHFSHRRAPPRSSPFATPSPIYGYNSGQGSSGMTNVLKGMSLGTSPPPTPHYQPIHTGFSGKPGYLMQQNIYLPTVPAGGAFPSQPQLQQPGPHTQPFYPGPATRSGSNPQYAQGGYPGPPTVYPLTGYGLHQSSVQPPVFYQRVYKKSGTRRKGSRRGSRSG